MVARGSIVLLLALALGACAPGVDRAAPAVPSVPPVAMAASPPPPRAIPVDLIVVDKSDRTLTLYGEGMPLRGYRGLQFGASPKGHKQFQGDERTPEGRYVIDYRNPRSAYHLSLHISYPDAEDRAFADAHGRSPGGDIFIHGQPNGQAERMAGDWTDGCIALANHEIEEIWQFVADGTPIRIDP